MLDTTSGSIQGQVQAPVAPELPRPPRGAGLSISAKLALIALTFAATIVGLSAVVAGALQLAAGARAFLGAEALWSKGQKDASYWLIRYLRTHDEADFARYGAAIAVPLGDQAARQALEQPVPDEAAAARGLLAGGNDAADIPAMIFFHRYLAHREVFAPAILIRTQADAPLQELVDAGQQAHAMVSAGTMGAREQAALLARVEQVTELLGAREQAFAQAFRDGARTLREMLLGAMLLAALLLLGLGLLVSWRISSGIGASIGRLRAGALRVSEGELHQPIEVLGGDELAQLAALFNDMMRRRADTEEALREAKEFSHRVMQGGSSSICVVDRAGRLTLVNRRTCEIAGRAEAELLNQPIGSLIAPEQRQQTMARLSAVLKTGAAMHDQETELLRPDGSRLTILFSASPLNKEGRIFALVMTAEDITERKRADAYIRHVAHHDALTNLPNRKLLLERMEKALQQARREHSMVAVLLIDLDNFKRINDTLGHAVGDRVLLQLSRLLQKCLRERDLVARLGGDEFVVMLTGIHVDMELEQVIAGIARAVATPLEVDGHELVVTPSIGGCVFPRDGGDTTTLLKHADTAMYQAKAAGRSNMQWFSEAMLQESRDKLALGGALRRALEQNELRVHYQPEISLHHGQVVGMEALLRWHHPELGYVEPSRFVQVAEETGQILALGEWVLRTACRECMAIRRRTGQELRVAVNVSPRQVQRQDLVELVRSALAESGLPARCLELEITESVLMGNPDEGAELLQRLRWLGAGVVIDDFGTGYSSLSYLSRFPLDKIKIDRSFVRNFNNDAADAAIIKAIIAMAHSLQVRVIAEGVETAEQEAYLRECGCDEVQGYLYSRAVPAGEFAA
jgi:diguanylate cyclase (GGDEF)-like protein/PAS domain S-box-containing protein